ncbi:Piso0_001932 [Millerozyma farinosa CBS 7064]|uniref:ATP-dependent DNA helicase CHL1 n=1 Tax=Pichia sorbitophila (strain ATCC MYA-4447 / BCRC 22081 / CBS 7064 / NBRC 10061 / NRRL Y-12695) TaxID=559304 RepID=G8YB88_PICSO|nr:Piso0_001932 [Millerozyma farinosa CBS 7064]
MSYNANETSDRHGTFNHPFEPYDIQLELMRSIYDAIENYKIGIFESPTGTGKTLSIICSTMTWLRNNKKKAIERKLTQNASDSDSSSSDDEPEWVKNAYNSNLLQGVEAKAHEYETMLNDLEKTYDHTHLENLEAPTKRSKISSDEDQLLPVDYHSDTEDSKSAESMKLSKEVSELLSRVEQGDSESGPEDEFECPNKIIFSSRTHSQLSQFAHQLGLTNFNPTFEGIPERIKFVPLASRKQLCIHPRISHLTSLDSINEACIDLQQNTKEGCAFNPKHGSMSKKKFSDLSFTKIHDIEDLGSLGTGLRVCPYYSVRNGLKSAEVIASPYQILLQKSARETLNVDVEDAIIVIDEAHNLIDTIISLYSVSINLLEIEMIIKGIRYYLRKFMKKLNSGNRINLMKLLKLCQSIQNFINKSIDRKESHNGSEVMVNEIFGDTTGDLINIYKVEKFLEKSKIAYKIDTYMEKEEGLTFIKKSSSPLLFKITKFLKCLANPSNEGKFFWNVTKDKTAIDYLLLDPSEIFRDIVSKCRCLILCGGTMEPMEDYKKYLFPYVPNESIKKFSCDHIIPDKNLIVFPIGTYGNSVFEFSYEKRGDLNMILNLGNVITQICENTKGGAVVFFPSYRYLNEVKAQWRIHGILRSIEDRRTVYYEPIDSADVAQILNSYRTSIESDNGLAIIFAVVGGKLSEGINFADDLARAVIMVGMPYPNVTSADLIARKEFIEKTILEENGNVKDARTASKTFYDNLCMRAVNQSIGRSIRHKDDSSLIYLIDQRYGYETVQSKLSGWVKKRLYTKSSCTYFNKVLEETTKFYTVLNAANK